MARAGIVLVALVSMVAVLSGSPSDFTGRSAASVGEPTAIGEPAAPQISSSQGGSRRTAPAASEPSIVPDPRPGDLRFDPNADLLPEGYAAAPADGIIRDIVYGPDESQRIDLYLPVEKNAPTIVFLHHGGWTSGDRTEVPEMVLRFLERGYAIASVGYRLAPEHPFPAPMHDVNRAVRELKALGEDTGLIDGDSFVLYGISAGGQLAAFTAATVGEFVPDDLTDAQAAHDSSVAGIVVNVGPSDLLQMSEHPHGWAAPMTSAHAGCDACTVEQLELPSPINHLHTDMPPAYWAYGELDPLVDPAKQGRIIADAWAAEAGGESSWFDLVDGQHHVLDETMINQRQLEAFVDMAVNR